MFPRVSNFPSAPPEQLWEILLSRPHQTGVTSRIYIYIDLWEPATNRTRSPPPVLALDLSSLKFYKGSTFVSRDFLKCIRRWKTNVMNGRALLPPEPYAVSLLVLDQLLYCNAHCSQRKSDPSRLLRSAEKDIRAFTLQTSFSINSNLLFLISKT